MKLTHLECFLLTIVGVLIVNIGVIFLFQDNQWGSLLIFLGGYLAGCAQGCEFKKELA